MPRVYTDEDKKRVVQYMVNNPTLQNKQVIEQTGISKSMFYNWKKEPWFQEMYHQMCQQRFKALQALAIQKLGEQVQEGVFSAVKYVLDGRGYNATQKIEAKIPTVISVTIEDEE